MRFATERVLPFAQEAVWAGLFNPSLLAAALPGIEELTPAENGETSYRIVAKLLMPVVTGKYEGTMEVVDQEPMSRYRLQGQAKGRLGWVKLDAAFELSAAGAQETRVAASMDFRVGGLLGSVGDRLLEGIAKGMMDDFFKQFVNGLDRVRLTG